MASDLQHQDRHEHEHEHEHDLGLVHDLTVLRHRDPFLSGTSGLSRRRALTVLGATGAVGVGLGLGLVSRVASPAGAAVTGGGCVRVPEETAGPFPGDGSNGPNVLDDSGVVRRDIRSSFGSLSGRARGIPLTIRMRVQDVSGGCSNLVGAAVYIWHCDRLGRYSLYSSGVTDKNYLRGVQATDDDGWVTFRSIFPGCYPGRWPHIHFEIYPSLASATSATNTLVISQIALPEAACRRVYSNPAYASSRSSLNGVSLASDGVFRDGSSRQLATTTGSNRNGWTARLTVGVP